MAEGQSEERVQDEAVDDEEASGSPVDVGGGPNLEIVGAERIPGEEQPLDDEQPAEDASGGVDRAEEHPVIRDAHPGPQHGQVADDPSAARWTSQRESHGDHGEGGENKLQRPDGLVVCHEDPEEILGGEGWRHEYPRAQPIQTKGARARWIQTAPDWYRDVSGGVGGEIPAPRHGCRARRPGSRYCSAWRMLRNPPPGAPMSSICRGILPSHA